MTTSSSANDKIKLQAIASKMRFSPQAKEMAIFLAKTIGLEFSIMQWQAAKATDMSMDMVDNLFNELIAAKFLKQQPRLKHTRTYVINRSLLDDPLPDAASTETLTPEQRRAQMRLVVK